MPLPQVILAALALGENATEQDAVTAINSLKSEKEVALNRANTPDLNLFVPKGTYEVALNRATTAEAALAAIDQQNVAALVQSAIDDGKVAPADKEMYVGLCSSETGREQFKKFIEGAPQIATNRQVKTPELENKPKLEEHEVAMCRNMGVTEDEFLAAKQTMNVGAK